MMHATALDEVQALRSENATLRREVERLREYDVPYWRDVIRKELAIEIEKRDAKIERLRTAIQNLLTWKDGNENVPPGHNGDEPWTWAARCINRR